jgi:hypothetical protein
MLVLDGQQQQGIIAAVQALVLVPLDAGFLGVYSGGVPRIADLLFQAQIGLEHRQQGVQL